MGSIRAIEAANEMTDMAGLDAALSYHLRANHYPPVPHSMIEPCKQAIEAAVNEEYDFDIDLPDGISYQGQNTAPWRAIVDAHHLGAFIDAAIERESE